MHSPESERRLHSSDQRLLHVIDSTFALASQKSGRHLVCRLGCTECCIGPFPITMLDARRLRKGLTELDARDPETAARIRVRAEQSVTMMASDFPGDVRQGDARQGVLHEEAAPDQPFWSQYGSVPCPALDPASGACELYAARPLTCRSFGPPLRVGAQSIPPCQLCFVGASEEEVESCRVEMDPDGLERAILDDLHAISGESGQTIIAFALGGGLAGRSGAL